MVKSRLTVSPARRDARDDGWLGASETDRLGREQQRRATAYGRARGAAVSGFSYAGRDHRVVPRRGDARAGLGVLRDARPRAGVARAVQPGEAPAPGPLPRAQGRRGVRLVPRAVPRRLGESSRWGTVFADDKLAATIVDRVVHHGRLVEFGGPSHRLEESLMLGKSGS